MRTRFESGTTLFVTLLTLAALSAMAAFSFQIMAPSLRTSYQTAAWGEARIAAESGVDAAVADLLRNETGARLDEWTRWKIKGSDGKPAKVPKGHHKKVLKTDLTAVATLLTPKKKPGPAAPTATEPIYLDNIGVSTTSDGPAEMDVQLWALRPADPSAKPWLRVRSMAKCALPPTATRIRHSFDSLLRRFSLRAIRERVRQDDVGDPTNIPLPYATRTVEALIEPVTPFELALWTDGPIKLPPHGDWVIDSYDSNNPERSNSDGTYPGKSDARTGDEATIASNMGRPASALVGPLIDAKNARVRGVIATNGGDDPSTPLPENVSGALNVDPEKVRDDFYREMLPVPRPSEFTLSPPPILGTPFLPGTAQLPTYYRIRGTLGGFRVAPALGNDVGGIVIMVDGDLNTIDGPIVIPNNVVAELYVRGNINFGDQSINSGGGSSNRPAQLMIFGGDGAGRRQLRAGSGAVIHAAFYGPEYDVSLDGGTSWFGAIAAGSFEAPHGGNGGLHYDRALSMIGPPISFRIVRYVEDVRQ